jgi:hypothetical protein
MYFIESCSGMAWLFEKAKQTYTQNIENKRCKTVNPGGELRQKGAAYRNYSCLFKMP